MFRMLSNRTREEKHEPFFIVDVLLFAGLKKLVALSSPIISSSEKAASFEILFSKSDDVSLFLVADPGFCSIESIATFFLGLYALSGCYSKSAFYLFIKFL